ncbi:MAG: polymorphic toxin-type HINT domain-containing protein [Planctomycetota bacterium]
MRCVPFCSPFSLGLEGPWVNSHEVRVGDVILTESGGEATVQQITQTFDESFAVSNITVEGDHNYAVGESSILVHNSDICEVAINKLRAMDPSGFDGFIKKVVSDGHTKDEILDAFRKAGQDTPYARSRIDELAPRRITQGKWGAKIDYNSGTQRAIDHIKNGHFFNSRPGVRSSRFSASNSTTSRVKSLVDDAIAKGRHSTNNRGDYSILHTFDDVIGTDINGRKTKTIQVFLDELGIVLNAYPVPRPR